MAAPAEVSPGKSLADFLKQHEIPFIGDPTSLDNRWRVQTYGDAILLQEKPGEDGIPRRVELTETEGGCVIAQVGLQPSSAGELSALDNSGPFPQFRRGSTPVIEKLQEVQLGKGIVLRGKGREGDFGNLKEEINLGDESGGIIVNLEFTQPGHHH